RFGLMFYYREGAFSPAAQLNVPETFSEFIQQRGSYQPAAGSTFEQLVRTKQVIHLADASEQRQFFSNNAAKLGGARTYLAVPMLKEQELIGAFAIYRQEVRPFTDKQIALVQNFANQAVVAIENTRLLNELRESLQQQTATSEVLRVVSSSPGDLRPVFQALLENATRVCASNFGTMYLREGDAFRTVAMHGAPPAYVEARMKEPVFSPGPGTGLGRTAQTREVVHVADVTAEPAYATRDPLRVAAVESGGARPLVPVLVRRGMGLSGLFSIYGGKVRHFRNKQFACLQNSPNQQFSRCEIARLLNELRESLQQQTATADVLKVIS